MNSGAFDVILVPDFSAAVRDRFETLTLLFLGSWLEYGGRSRKLPLHLACIGKAPSSVRILAERCGAELSEHSPMALGPFANKLRGFEVKRRTEQFLLLDSDMLAFSDISGLAAELEPFCIAASASNGPRPGSEKVWREIHATLGIAQPEGSFVPLNRELDTFQSSRYRDRDPMGFPPYYNGGIVFGPWDSGLGELWRDHMERIATISTSMRGPNDKLSNQPSLATAIARARQNGTPLRKLPDEYHVRWQHISCGALSVRTTRLFHSIGFGRHANEVGSGGVAVEIDRYLCDILDLTRRVRSHRSRWARLRDASWRRPRLQECRRIHDRMTTIYWSHIRELKE